MSKSHLSVLHDNDLQHHLEKQTLNIEHAVISKITAVITRRHVDSQLFINEVIQSIAALKVKVAGLIDPVIEKLKMQIEHAELPAYQQASFTQERRIKRQTDDLLIDIDRMTQHVSPVQYYFNFMGSLACVGVDVFMNFRSLQTITATLLGAFVLSFFIAVLLFIAATTTGKVLRNSNSKMVKTVFVCLSLLGSSALFYFLGCARNQYYGDNGFSAVLLWIIICTFFYCISIVLSAMRFRSKKEEGLFYLLQSKRGAVDDLDRMKSALLKEATKKAAGINEMTEDILVLSIHRNNLYSFLDAEETRIIGLIKSEYAIKWGGTVFQEMKNISLILMAIFSTILFTSCTRDVVQSQLSVIADETESFFPDITGKDVRGISSITDYMHNGEAIRITAISEFPITSIYEYAISGVSNIFRSNDYRRPVDTAAYFHQIDSALRHINAEKMSRPSSCVIATLINELNFLSHVDADIKHCIIYSDCMETKIANFYDPIVLKAIKERPSDIEAMLFHNYPLDSLPGIDITLIFDPETQISADRFVTVSSFLADIFRKKGATVSVRTNL